MPGPLHAVRILDLSRLLPGPAATWYLQGMGAEVDRVETPGRGDFTRGIPPFVDGVGAYFAAVSRGKRSVAIDLRSDRGRALIRRMLHRYDVLVEGFKPGVLESMGLAPDALVAAHPGLVVARISGYGQDSTLAHAPGHDINYLGYAGVLAGAAVGAEGPVVPPVQVADFTSAMVAAMGIAAALFEREHQQRLGIEVTGRVLDVSLTDASLSLMAPQIAAFTAQDRDAIPGGELLSGGASVYGCYRCADGRWLTVGALEPKFQALLAAGTGGELGRADLATVFATRPRDAWVADLHQACVGPMLAVSELTDHPLFAARGQIERIAGASWVRPPLCEPDAARGPVPGLGEHTGAVLADAGLDPDELTSLHDDGVIA